MLTLDSGGRCQNSWFAFKWDKKFIQEKNLTIQFLEMYAVTVSIKLWIHKFANKRIAIYCDNLNCDRAINDQTTSCRSCLKLLRLVILEGMKQERQSEGNLCGISEKWNS